MVFIRGDNWTNNLGVPYLDGVSLGLETVTDLYWSWEILDFVFKNTLWTEKVRRKQRVGVKERHLEERMLTKLRNVN